MTHNNRRANLNKLLPKKKNQKRQKAPLHLRLQPRWRCQVKRQKQRVPKVLLRRNKEKQTKCLSNHQVKVRTANPVTIKLTNKERVRADVDVDVVAVGAEGAEDAAAGVVVVVIAVTVSLGTWMVERMETPETVNNKVEKGVSIVVCVVIEGSDVSDVVVIVVRVVGNSEVKEEGEEEIEEDGVETGEGDEEVMGVEEVEGVVIGLRMMPQHNKANQFLPPNKTNQ